MEGHADQMPNRICDMDMLPIRLYIAEQRDDIRTCGCICVLGQVCACPALSMLALGTVRGIV